MAQTVKDTTLDTRTARGRLAVRGKPYYRAIDPGVHLGYRRGSSGGVWCARVYLGEGKYRLEKIGTADDKADADGVAVLSFAQAQAAARKLHVGVARAAAGLPAVSTGPLTVAAALADYVAWLEGEGRSRHSIADTRTKAASAIAPTLGHVRVDRLTRAQIEHWFHTLAKTPPRVRTAPGAKARYRSVDMRDPETRRKRQASANRMLTILRAALTHAWRRERVPSDAAWRRLKAFKGTMQSRARFLTLDECQRLLNAADPDFRQITLAGLYTGCRWSELRRLAPGDFNAAGTLTIRTSKSGKGRHVVLNDDGARFFEQAVAMAKAEQRAHLFVRDDGKAWGGNWQVPLMVAASEGAGIRPPATFHLLRHSWASHAIMGGLPLTLAAKNLGHATTQMCEHFYSHLAEDYATREIRRAAPSFKSLSDGVVTRLRAR